MIKNRATKILFLALIGVFSIHAHATLLTLDSLPVDLNSQTTPQYKEAGFQLDFTYSDRLNVMDTDGSLIDANSTRAAAWGANNRFLQTSKVNGIFSLTASNGETFDFYSLDVGRYNNTSVGPAWQLTAYDQAGVQKGDVLQLTQSGTAIIDWTNIFRVDFTQTVNVNSSLDNLSLSINQSQPDNSVPVPTPGALLLTASGLLLMPSLRRRPSA